MCFERIDIMLNEVYKSNKFELIYIIKEDANERSNDVEEFIKDKRAVFLSAINYGMQRNVIALKKAIENVYGTYNHELSVADNLINFAKNERVVIVIDNFAQFNIKEEDSVAEDFLNKISTQNIMLVILSKKKAVDNGYISGVIDKFITKVIEPTKKGIFDEIYDKDIPAYDKFVYYSIFGDKKSYINSIDKNKNLRENLINTLLNRESIFRYEATRIIKEELREPQVYNVILETIANGANTLNEIAERMNLPTSICNKYNTVLISLGIVDKIKPIFEENSRKSRYKIHNNFLEFWNACIVNNISEIDLGKSEKVYDNEIALNLDKYLEKKFPDICGEYIEKCVKENKIDLEVKEKGIWWDKEEKIDIVIGNGLSAIVADCYFTLPEVGIDKLKELEQKAAKVDVAERKYYLFARNSFSDELRRAALERDDIKLITFNDMCEQNEEKTKKRFFFSRR